MGDNKYAVSVIIPLYNASQYVGFCMESIFNQTFKDFELIIIDDASTDNSYDLCREICRERPGVTLVKNPVNSGQCACRNKGISMAKGKYLYFMDSDDELLPEALETLYKIAEENQAEVVHNNLLFISYAEGCMLSRVSLLELVTAQDCSGGWLEGTRTERMCYQHCSSLPMVWLDLIRRDFLLEADITFPDLAISEDDVFSTELAFRAERFMRINNPLYVYRKYLYEGERVRKRLPKAFKLMCDAMTVYSEMFDRYPQEEIPYSLRMELLSGWLRAHLKFWIYDILDTDKEEGFLAVKKYLDSLFPSPHPTEMLLLYLIHMNYTDSGVKDYCRQEIAQQRERFQKVLEEAEKKGSKEHQDYPCLYSKAKRASMLSGGDDRYYWLTYSCLGEAAFRLGRYQEAWKACELALKVGDSDTERYKELFAVRQKILPYLAEDSDLAEGIESAPVEIPSLSDEYATSLEQNLAVPRVLPKLQSGVITFGVCSPYYAITDEMLTAWRAILGQVPGARLVLWDDELREQAMLVEVSERFMQQGIDPQRVRFQWDKDRKIVYRCLDILLDTYPVSQEERVLEAMVIGVPVISRYGRRKESRGSLDVLKRVGLEELSTQSSEEYISRAVSLAGDMELLKILHENLPRMVKKAW